MKRNSNSGAGGMRGWEKWGEKGGGHGPRGGRGEGGMERSRNGRKVRDSRGRMKRERRGSSKKNRREWRKREARSWVKGRAVSSGIRSRKRITCYPTSPTGIWPPWPSLAREYCCRSALTPSSNVFSAAPYLHVYFSPASATIPDVVETNSSCTGRKLTSRPTRMGIHIPLFLLSLRVYGQPASRLDLEEKQMALPGTRIEGDRQRSPVYQVTNSLFPRMRRVEVRFKSKWTAPVKLPAPGKW